LFFTKIDSRASGLLFSAAGAAGATSRANAEKEDELRMERPLSIRYGSVNLAATLHYPAWDNHLRESRRPVVVICHGFVGNRIGTDRLFVKAARELAVHGFIVLRFDYAGCGESEGDYGATGMDSWIEQTRYALDEVLELDFADPENVTLLGHSLGGAVAVLTGAVDRRVRNLVLWAPVGHPLQDIVSIVGQAKYEEAVTQGAADYAGYQLQTVFFQSLSAAQPFLQAKQFPGDVLLVHGSSDPVITAEYSFLYQKVFRTRQNGGLCDKEIVLHADHTFSAVKHAAQAIGHTVDWLKNKDDRKLGWYEWEI
jgi:hypothetical protein